MRALIILLTLAGCTTTPLPTSNPRQIWCDQNKPRRFSKATLDTFTRSQIDQENGYIDRGILWCGWSVK